MFDLTTLQGWSTCLEYDHPPPVEPFAFPLLDDASVSAGAVCPTCGSALHVEGLGRVEATCVHGGLVRSVAMGEELVLSGSYDLSIKVCVIDCWILLLLTCLSRYGIGKPESCLPISPEVIWEGYSAWASIAPRSVASPLPFIFYR